MMHTLPLTREQRAAASREALHDALRNASTADLFWALGEILTPSNEGPFLGRWGDDDFFDALAPVETAFEATYSVLDSIVNPDPACAEHSGDRRNPYNLTDSERGLVL